jgi:putative ABC transport system permease protein
MPVLPGIYSIFLVSAAVATALILLARLGRVPLLYNLRNLLVRWRTSCSTTLAFTMVIALFIIMLAFVQGFLRMAGSSGHPANIMVLSRGATDELVSTITAQEASVDLALQPGIVRNSQGQPLCTREVYVVVNQLLPSSTDGKTKRRLIQVRGVEDSSMAAAVHDIGALSAGEWFSSSGVRALPIREPGTAPRYAIETVIGASCARQWHLNVAETIEIGPRLWIVTGILPATGSTIDSEVWARHQQVGQIFGKEHSFTSMLLRTRDAEAARKVAEDLNQNYKKASFHIEPETEYYTRLAQTNQGFLIAVYVLALIIAVGGVLGVMNTMFAAVTQRRKDIAMLRILGFARWQLLLSFLIEALLLSLVGGSLGCVLGSLAHGWSANSLVGNRNMAFTLRVDGWTLSTAVLLTVAMGALGGLLPAISTSRVRPLEALRAG